MLVFFLSQTFGSEVVRYTSLVIGGGVAGFTCKKKDWLFGGIVGLVINVTVAAVLVEIALEGSRGGLH